MGLIAVVAAAVLASGLYESGAFGSSTPSNSVTINITITGGVGGNTVDTYYPDTFTVRLGQNVTLAVDNTDDNTHGLVIKAFGVDTGKILPGDTDRVHFMANETGTFVYYEPPGYCTGGFGNVCNSIQHMIGNMTVSP